MAKIKWTFEAEKWLKDIYDYIAKDNVSIAKEVINNIYQRVQSLKRLPKQGYRYSNCSNKEVRILLYGHYRIAYLIHTNQTISILGVFHGAIDIDRYLF